jgi:hypothetical protein
VIKRVKALLGMSKPAGTPLPVRPSSAQSGRLITSAEVPGRATELAAEPAVPTPLEGGTAKDDREMWESVGEVASFEPERPSAPPAVAAPAKQSDSGDSREVVAEKSGPMTYGDLTPAAVNATGLPAADAFARLWAHEQGEPPPPAPPPPPLQLSEDSIAALASRLADRLAARVTDDLAARLIDGLAARLADSLAARVTDDLARRMTLDLAQQLSDSLADRLASGLAAPIAAQLAERVLQNAFGESLRLTVHDVSERLVREEIARIRAAAQGSRS